MTTGEARAMRWQRIAGMSDTEINLAEAALLIAAEEYPNLDIDAYLDRLDDMAAVLRRRLRQDITTTETVLSLNHYLFRELGYAGNAENYYDHRNSFLNEVMDRRLGIPLTLSIIYLEVGRRIGLPLHGVSFPGNFLVKCEVRDGVIVLDPYAGGTSLGLEDLLGRLNVLRGADDADSGAVTGLLAAARNREIITRMLRNLKGIYLQQKDMLKALSATERIIALAPTVAEEYRDRGGVYLELECFRAAQADFSRYLALKPDAEDSDAIRRHLARLEQVVARLN